MQSESESERKPEVPASPRDEALFHCAEPSRVPRGPANSTASLTSQRHPGKFPIVPAEVEGNEGFPPPPEKDLESPSSTRLEALVISHDSRVMTSSPRHAHGDMSSLAPHKRLPEVLVVPRDKPPRAPQPEETHETPPSSRDEGLLLLYGLESNPESSLQTPQEA